MKHVYRTTRSTTFFLPSILRRFPPNFYEATIFFFFFRFSFFYRICAANLGNALLGPKSKRMSLFPRLEIFQVASLNVTTIGKYFGISNRKNCRSTETLETSSDCFDFPFRACDTIPFVQFLSIRIPIIDLLHFSIEQQPPLATTGNDNEETKASIGDKSRVRVGGVKRKQRDEGEREREKEIGRGGKG